jgi:hypothetical protein
VLVSLLFLVLIVVAPTAGDRSHGCGGGGARRH